MKLVDFPFCYCVASWRSIIARPIVADNLSWRNLLNEYSLAVVVGNPNTHVTHGQGRGWQWLRGPCCSPVCCVYSTFLNIYTIVSLNDGSIGSNGGRASSRRTMSLETLLEAARYVELQEAQRLQQSSSSVPSSARGTSGKCRNENYLRLHQYWFLEIPHLYNYWCEFLRIPYIFYSSISFPIKFPSS